MPKNREFFFLKKERKKEILKERLRKRKNFSIFLNFRTTFLSGKIIF